MTPEELKAIEDRHKKGDTCLNGVSQLHPSLRARPVGRGPWEEAHLDRAALLTYVKELEAIIHEGKARVSAMEGTSKRLAAAEKVVEEWKLVHGYPVLRHKLKEEK